LRGGTALAVHCGHRKSIDLDFFSPEDFSTSDLLRKYTLLELIEFFENKYTGIRYNLLHILKSLVYFNDADGEPSPVMLKDIDWNVIKQSIRLTVSALNEEHEYQMGKKVP